MHHELIGLHVFKSEVGFTFIAKSSFLFLLDSISVVKTIISFFLYATSGFYLKLAGWCFYITVFVVNRA